MSRRARWCGTCIYMAVAGLLLLALGWLVVGEGATAAATTLFVFGGGALVATPFVARLEGALKIGPLQLTIRQQVINAVQEAGDASLEGVLPLLTSEDVSITKLTVPARFDGKRLTDPELAFLRQKLNVTAIGALLPGEERWRAGGVVSELPLREGTELLVAGHPETLSYLRLLIASDNDDLWQRVT